MSNSIKVNKYLPIAVLYFFFNGFLLPLGLLYTTLLTPLFLLWLYRYPSINLLWFFPLITVPFALVHFLNGVNTLAYIKSYLLFFSVFVFCAAFHRFLKECTSLRQIFRSLIIINIFFVLIALIALIFPSFRDRFWYNNAITSGVSSIHRLKLLTYEPSYYSTLLVPVLLYYYLKMFFTKLPNKLLVFLMVTIPLLLSLSFGVILGVALSLLLLFLSDVKLFTLKRKFPIYIIYGGILAMLLFIVFLQLFPDNVFFVRMANVFSGKDTSFNGRTFDSFYLGWKIAAEKSILFGAGPGQIKSIGLEFFREFYNYSGFTESEIGIPNSVGDTLAIFGVLGVLIRMTLEVVFFFKTKVYTNFLRLSLFIFVFIYQFTGSFITNIAEYVIWIMAFSPWLFKEFDKENVYRNYNSSIAKQ
jgi:hypothetical protein